MMERVSEHATCDLQVGGMDCASCASAIEHSLSTLEGVDDVRVDVIGGRVRVGYRNELLTTDELAGAIRRVGFTVKDESRGHVGDRDAGPESGIRPSLGVRGRSGRFATTAVSGVLLLTGLVLGWLGAESGLTMTALILSAIAGGWFIVPQGVRAARHRALDMNFLMSVAAVGAGAIGQWGEAASAMFLFSVAQLLESYSMDRARNAIKALMDLSPTEATVYRAGADVVVPASEVDIGETILVRPGQKIPLDGVVVAGRSAVNEASITGESMPVDKEPGGDVFAGSINAQGSLDIRVTRHVGDTTLARIIHAVEEAQSAQAPSQTFVDRFARIYTPVVVFAAILIAIVPPSMGLGTWETWIYRSLTMLVVACPCALVISTPITIVSGLAGAARAGILIKGGMYLERLGAITVVALDKTGTLTEGRPVVRDIVALSEHISEEEVLRLAAAVERHSEHPLARAIVELAAVRGLAIPVSVDFEALISRGTRASVDGHAIYLGNVRLIQEHGLLTPILETALLQIEASGKTAVVVATEREAVGIIAIADQVRSEANNAIAALLKHGITPVMLTGDAQGPATAVATQLGISNVHAKLLPDDKVRLVQELERNGARVAFVGDGVNDAPALATATVGVAMGVAGTDVALETADVALMADDLMKLPTAVALAQRVLGIIKQNIVFALVIKAVFLVLAATGYATLWMAVAADMGASLAVIANGLRALKVSERAAHRLHLMVTEHSAMRAE
ncbi:MAG: cation-translocating P-type ATPase [Gemmatimonadota bacterium]